MAEITLDSLFALSKAADAAEAKAAEAKKEIVNATRRAAAKQTEAEAARKAVNEAKAAFEAKPKK
jgi:predicted  nucleic acid-binding Zn-ribbon protein